jgi:hypothetical protein
MLIKSNQLNIVKSIFFFITDNLNEKINMRYYKNGSENLRRDIIANYIGERYLQSCFLGG